jgi:hypothetical protein
MSYASELALVARVEMHCRTAAIVAASHGASPRDEAMTLHCSALRILHST